MGCKFIETILPIAGGVAGFVLGGPAGAAVGAGLGSAAGGGNSRQNLIAAGLGFAGGVGANYLGAGTQAAAGASTAYGSTGALAGAVPGDAFLPGAVVGSVAGTGAPVATGAAVTAAGLGAGATAGNVPWTTRAGSVLDIASGVYGLSTAAQISELAAQAAAQQDPFASQRSFYSGELAALERDPSSIENRPGYKFGRDQGEQALLRQTAATGFGGSGNEAIALQEYNQAYAGMYLNAEQQRLASLAGAGFAPTGGNTRLMGELGAAQLSSQALASIGYGLGRWGG